MNQAPASSHAPLVFEGIVKSFGGTRALKGVSMQVHPGEVVALLGENGAGKSTLIKILGGIHKADGGAITIGGTPYHHRASRFGQQQALAFIHQDLGLVEWMTVAENMALALGYARCGGLVSWPRVEKLAAQALAKVRCDIAPTARVHSLTRTEKALVAIARALAVDCRFLVLDEPTASLPADEVAQLLDAIRGLRAQGVGMIYVSHRLSEVFEIADRVVVLRDGEVVSACAVAETDSASLVRDIVGGSTRASSKAPAGAGRPVLDVRNLRTAQAGPASFKVLSGEILGLVGLRGAGHESIARAIYGAPRGLGQILLDGSQPDLSSPVCAMRAGIGLVARDRLEESVAPGLSIRENFFLNPLALGRKRWQLLSRSREARLARQMGSASRSTPTTRSCPSRRFRAATSKRW